jgi:hypothetical protein
VKYGEFEKVDGEVEGILSDGLVFQILEHIEGDEGHPRDTALLATYPIQAQEEEFMQDAGSENTLNLCHLRVIVFWQSKWWPDGIVGFE